MRVSGNPAFYARSGRPRGCTSKWSSRALTLATARRLSRIAASFTAADIASHCRLTSSQVNEQVAVLVRGGWLQSAGHKVGGKPAYKLVE